MIWVHNYVSTNLVIYDIAKLMNITPITSKNLWKMYHDVSNNDVNKTMS